MVLFHILDTQKNATRSLCICLCTFRVTRPTFFAAFCILVTTPWFCKISRRASRTSSFAKNLPMPLKVTKFLYLFSKTTNI
uniref:Uncharacterized protein n=1 Tax=Amphimedon queenslandica TaxID=400682 RepID=A0A1X7UPA7_AMPQE